MTQTAQRVGIFVDSANLFYAQRNLGWWIDWKRLLTYLTTGQELYNAFYYTAQAPSDKRTEESFHAYLTMSGYTVRKKPLRRIYDHDGEQIADRGNCDVELVVDAMTTTDLYDAFVLCSGDKDFEALITHLRAIGKHITVVSEPQSISLELRNISDRYVDLSVIRSHIERLDRQPAPVVAWEQGGETHGRSETALHPVRP